MSRLSYLAEETVVRRRVGAAIRAARYGLGISVAEYAKRFGCTKRQVLRMESGGTCIPLFVLRQLCLDLGLSADEVLNITPEAAE